MVLYYIAGAFGTLLAGSFIVSSAKTVWRKKLRRKVKGRTGESKVNKTLNSFKRSGGQVRNDILIPSPWGTSQIDHVLVSKQGIFVVETKNFTGVVTGNENDRMWRQMHPGSFSPPKDFHNPVKQNEGHIKALQIILDLDKNVPIYSIVAFSNKCIHPILPGVVNFANLKRAIRSKGRNSVSLSKQEIGAIMKKIDAATIGEKSARQSHIFRAGLHGSSKEEVEELRRYSRNTAKDVYFPPAPKEKPESEELTARHLLTDIYAEIKIRGVTDTIENFFENAKRREDGAVVCAGDTFHHFICPYTGDRFPPTEAINFYQGMWISYLNRNPKLVEFMHTFGVEKLGNSFQCKKALNLYASDKEGFTNKVKASAWYQNMVSKQRPAPLSSQIDAAAKRAGGSCEHKPNLEKER